MYGSVELTGYEWRDTVCIAETACVSNFDYFLIDQQTGINGYQGLQEPMDGILGMSRDRPNPKYNMVIGPLYVKALSEN